jgi:hypothetical protein
MNIVFEYLLVIGIWELASCLTKTLWFKYKKENYEANKYYTRR